MKEKKETSTTVDFKIRYTFETSSGDFNLILRALKKFGGNAEILRANLESQRAKNTKAMIERFAAYVNLKSADGSEEEE